MDTNGLKEFREELLRKELIAQAGEVLEEIATDLRQVVARPDFSSAETTRTALKARVTLAVVESHIALRENSGKS
jgi:hypothetical protein